MDYSVFRPKKAEKKPAPEPARAPAPEPLKPTPHIEGSRHRFSGFMDPYMDAWGGGGRYFTDMTDYLSSNRRLNQIELTNTRRITFHFNEFEGSYYDAPPIPWSNRHHHDDDYHGYGRNPFALPRTSNYMLPPPPMQSPSRYYGGGYELPYYSMPPPPPPGRYPSYFY